MLLVVAGLLAFIAFVLWVIEKAADNANISTALWMRVLLIIAALLIILNIILHHK